MTFKARDSFALFIQQIEYIPSVHKFMVKHDTNMFAADTA